ncbi:hypothetical protein Anapl_11441 [Anas platyrhynchos]|uniref:Uncharacterized protein n=1 Tax=Anas platyrhynchos TaxID=8839 RepID=R0LAM1_ANAPL|nr:hypothetical protein Anapl_11441 [Anas platyrhynchos]
MPGFLCQNLRVYTASELCDASPFPKAPRREALPSPRHGQLLVLVLRGWGRAEPLEARPCSCMEALACWLCVTFSSAKCVQRAKERCEGRCCPPAAILQPPQRAFGAPWGASGQGREQHDMEACAYLEAHEQFQLQSHAES